MIFLLNLLLVTVILSFSRMSVRTSHGLSQGAFVMKILIIGPEDLRDELTRMATEAGLEPVFTDHVRSAAAILSGQDGKEIEMILLLSALGDHERDRKFCRALKQRRRCTILVFYVKEYGKPFDYGEYFWMQHGAVDDYRIWNRYGEKPLKEVTHWLAQARQELERILSTPIKI
jgi:hypothetical protein